MIFIKNSNFIKTRKEISKIGLVFLSLNVSLSMKIEKKKIEFFNKLIRFN